MIISFRGRVNIVEILRLIAFNEQRKYLLFLVILHGVATGLNNCINCIYKSIIIVFTTILQIEKELIKSTDTEVNKVSHWLREFENLTISYIPVIVLAVLLFFLGLWGIRIMLLGLKKRFKKKYYDPALQLFLISVIRLVLFVVLFILIAGVLGLNITGIAALLAGAGLAVGSALNGTLGNLTGGVMILLLRPFKVGDLIEAQGYFGTVHEIGIVYTILINAENKTILLPNGNLSTGIITNYSQQNNLRINLKFPLKSDVNIDKAREIAIQEILKCNGTIKELAEAWVTDISESQITLQISCRIQIIPYDYKNHQQYLKDYYRTYYTLNENIVKAFIDNNIYKNT